MTTITRCGTMAPRTLGYVQQSRATGPPAKRAHLVIGRGCCSTCQVAARPPPQILALFMSLSPSMRSNWRTAPKATKRFDRPLRCLCPRNPILVYYVCVLIRHESLSLQGPNIFGLGMESVLGENFPLEIFFYFKTMALPREIMYKFESYI